MNQSVKEPPTFNAGLRHRFLATLCLCFFCLPGMLCSFHVRARVISPQEAQERLFKTRERKASTALQSTAKIELLQTIEASGEPAVYLFSKNEQGFYILAADDSVEPLLGYGEKGLSEISVLPPAMEYLLGEYAREIEWSRSHNVTGETSLRQTTKRERIAPLLTTAWAQGEPFNNLCPLKDGKRCLTGCVATSMAQVMNYHKYPSSANTSSGTVTFDWTNMLNSYSGSYTEPQAKAVATLMSVCGQAVDMNYGLDESGASDWNAGKALIELFGYNPNIDYLSHDCYTPTEWNDIVYNQLKEFGPVIYSGHSPSAGHAFVVDGYESDDYFHVNWGWGGGADGYFKLTALDPGNPSATGFANNDGIVANIRPEVSEAAPAHSIVCGKGLTVSPTSCTLGNSVEVGYMFSHKGYESVSATVGFRIVGAGGNQTIIKCDNGARSFAPNSYIYYVGLTIPTGFADGSYKVYPVFTVDDVTYDMPVCQNGNQYLELTVASGKATFKGAGQPEIVFKGVTMKSQFYRNRAVTFDYTVENRTENEVSKNFCAALFDSSFSTLLATGPTVSVSLGAGETVTGQYSGKFNTYPAAGTYYFGLYNPDTKKVYAYTTVQLQEEPATAISASAMEIIGGTTEVKPEEVKFSVNLTCSEGYYSDALYVFVFKEGETSSNWMYTLQDIRLSAGETVNREFTIDLTTGDPDYNSKYFLTLVQPGSTTPLAVSPLFSIFNGIGTGISTSGTQELPVAEEIYTLDGIRVSGGVRPGIYIVIERYSDGRVTTKRVIVNNAQ